MKTPTVITTTPRANPFAPAATSSAVAPSTTTDLQPFVGSQIVLSEAQLPQAQEMLGKLDFVTLQGRQVVLLGAEVEQALNETLNGFMVNINTTTAAPLFALFDRLQKGVKDADLPGILEKVQNAKPGKLALIWGGLRHKGAAQVAQEVINEIAELIGAKAKNLKSLLDELEKQLAAELAKTNTKLDTIEHLRIEYGHHFNDFTVVAAVMEAFTKQAKAYVEKRRVELAQDTSTAAREEMDELQTKLQQLESRSLALVGTWTRIPADAVVIRNIENSGVMTIGEIMTTASSRFASIKMTLITLDTALGVKGLQNIADNNRKIDNDLLSVRRQLVKDITTTAANAPGENRLAQVEQIKQIIADATELQTIVDTARTSNEQKFEQARQGFAEAQKALADLKK